MLNKVLFLALIGVVTAGDITLITFDGSATDQPWKEQNDPVMGGQSTGTFTVKDQLGVFDGDVVDVPFLKAPGFIKATASTKPFPDASSCTGLKITARASEDYKGYRLSFGNKHAPDAKFFTYGFKAHFDAPVGDNFSDIVLPFTNFTDDWDDATGDAIKTCQDNKEYCPDLETLKDMKTMSVWGEGVGGKVHLEIKSIAATGCTASPAVSLADPSKTIVENAVATPALSTLVSVLTTKGYEPVLKALSGPGNFTVFAPNNEAFKAAGVDPSQVDVVTQVLMYHVLGARVSSGDLKAAQFPATLMKDPKFVNEGGHAQVLGVYKTHDGVFINFGLVGDRVVTAKVVVADVQCSNGVVHVIDKVLMFPGLVSKLAEEARLLELVAALKKAELVDAVDTSAGVTIFAPDDLAFVKIGGISKLTKDQLTPILKYHVVPAVAFSTDLTDGQELPTLNGEKLKVSIKEGRVFINSAEVIFPNSITENGAVHVIRDVLIPKAAQQF